MINLKWLQTCATAGEFLYGHYTVTVLKKMYEKKKGCTISTNDLIDAMNELAKSGEVLMEYCSGRLEDEDDDLGFFVPVDCEGTELEAAMKKADADGNPYASIHLDDDERIDLMDGTPEGLKYYIPTEHEITQLVEEGYIRTPAMEKLEEKIRSNGGDPEYLKGLWSQVSADKLDMMEAINAVMNGMYPQTGLEEDADVPEEMMAHIPTLDDLNSMMPLINEFLNNVNLRSRRGWRPKELFKKMHPKGLTQMPTIMPESVHAAKTFREAEPQLRAMGAKVDYSSIDNFLTIGSYGERKVVKVGRNDPCPCGSGLKYKRCHGK